MTTGQPQSKRGSKRHWVFQGLLLLAVWLLLSGHYDVMHIGLGVVSVGLVLFMNRDFCREVACNQSGADRVHWLRFLAYVPWLLWQMVMSSLHVARVIFSPRMHLQPSVVHFRSAQPNESAAVVLGNSITLTPGTLTLEIEEDDFTVHCLTAKTKAGLLDGSMQRRVARLFVNQPGEMVFDIRRERNPA